MENWNWRHKIGRRWEIVELDGSLCFNPRITNVPVRYREDVVYLADFQPIILYYALQMDSKVFLFILHHLKYLKSLFTSDNKNVPTLRFISPTLPGKFTLEATSDAFMTKPQYGRRVGRSLLFAYLVIKISPYLLWTAQKIGRSARSSSTSEILAATDAVSALTYFQCMLPDNTYFH